MNSLAAFAMNQLQSNPKFANNPQAQALMTAIQSGDSAKGEQIAHNICQTMGVSEQEALGQAKQFFGIK